MNCQDFETVVRDLAYEQTATRMTGELKAAADHVEGCRTCELKLQDERELRRRLAIVASANSEPSSLIEAALVQAYRQTLADSENAAVVSSPASFRRSAWFAIAAALLIVLGVVVLRTKLAPKPVAVEITPAASIAENPTRSGNPDVNAPSTVGRDEPKRNLPPRAARRVNHRSVKPARTDSTPQVAVTVQQTEPEIASQFIALGAVGPMSFQDGGQIVRVEVSRLAMASFGLPVNMDRSGERVTAEVLLSADGFARAIRFIQ